MRWTRRFAWLALGASAVVGAVRRPALAVGSTDYTVTTLSGLYEAPPAGAKSLGLTRIGTPVVDVPTARVDLPFLFPYFGGLYDHVRPTVAGFVRIGSDDASYGPPADPASVGAASYGDGACAPLWQQLYLPQNTNVVAWTAGTAPNRRVIVSYENVGPAASPSMQYTYQVKFHESGRIDFAYKPDTFPSTWAGLAYASGLVAPGADPRWVAPVNQSATNSVHPGADYSFEPRFVTVTGRATYDRLTPTAAGLGTATTSVPATGVRVEGLFADGRLAGRADTDANGNFAMVTTPSSPQSPWEVWISARGAASVVRYPGSPGPPVKRIGTGLVVEDDTDAGTFLLDAASDPQALVRGPVNVASAIGRAHLLVSASSAATIPQIDVTLDTTAGARTAYAPSVVSAATLAVAGQGAANPDTWDDGPISVAYGRHLLAALGAVQATSLDDRLGTATNDANAFGAAFGAFLHAAGTGATQFVDSTGVSSASALDLETPDGAAAKSPDVAHRVAAGLSDLSDPANEPGDPVDGTLNAVDRVVRTLDAMSVVPDAASFLDAWWAAGFDGPGASRVWIAHGLVADDAAEPNDGAPESAPLGDLGVRRDGLTLNPGNEDWFDLVLPAATGSVVCDVAFPRTATPATVELELLTPAGVRVADKVDAGTGPVTLTAGPLAAGTYRLRVVHAAGRRVPFYTLQAARRLEMDHANLPPWTVGIAYQTPIALSGGIGTLSFSVLSGTAPTGLLFDAANQRAAGTPVAAGTFDFTLGVADSGNPVHTDFSTHHLVVNAALDADLGEFVPFAAGRAVHLTLPHTGGTPPIDVTLTSGDLPDGLTLSNSEFTFTGTPAAAGSAKFAARGVDVAGSADEDEATAVVCVAAPSAKTQVGLAAGDAACGVWFDGVAGSSVKLSVATAPKRARRALRGVVLGSDGAVLASAPVKPGPGKASAKVAALPSTGRWFLVVASAAGDATELLATATVAPPKSAKGSVADVDGGDVVPVQFGALAGAKLAFKATPARGSGQTLQVLALIDPDGNAVPIDGLASQKGASALVAATLAKSGTWTVRVRASGAAAGSIAYSLKLAQPKGGTFSAD